MADITKKQFAENSLWKIIESFSTKGVTMLVSIVLARILIPEDYGVIALASIFTGLCDVLIDGGLSTALIRKEAVDNEDYSCAFTVSFLLAIFLYFILFFSAPSIAIYYNEAALTPVLRVVCLVFFLQAFAATRCAILNREMRFKEFFYLNIFSNIFF